MPEALALVKRELGPDALILGTRTLPAGGLAGLAGREQVEITATRPDGPKPSPDPGRKSGTDVVARPPDVSPLIYPYYVRLVQNEVAADLARQLVEQAASRAATAGDVRRALQAVIREFISSHTLAASDSPTREPARRRIALVGPPGGGKTTTLVKLAAEYLLRRQQSVAILSLDAHGIGRAAQLRHYAELLGLPIRVAQTVFEVEKSMPCSDRAEVTLIDTPGIGFRDQGRFARTVSLLRAARPDETHLVLPASFTPEVQQRTLEAFRQFELRSVILTRLDEVVGAGVLLNVMKHLNISLSYVTNGQNVPRDLKNACETQVDELVLATSG
jgi:flagellar biosynthesis protein FlhF